MSEPAKTIPFLCPACRNPVGQAVEIKDGTDERHVYCWNQWCLDACRDGGSGRTFEAAFADLERAYRAWIRQEQGESHE